DERQRDKKEDERMQHPRAPQLGGLPEQSESANREDYALHDVVLDRHAEAFVAAPRQTRYEHERPGDDEQHDRGREKTEDCPLRLAGAAKLREHQWDEKQLEKSAPPRDAVPPT